MAEESVPNETWRDDLLSRRQLAQFLYNHVLSRFNAIEKRAHGALCFALDGDWGTGKTYFVSQWAQDIRSCEHPVVVFDAWKHDLSEDPLLAFVAVLNSELREWEKKTSIGAQVGSAVAEEFRGFIKKASRAIRPISTAILSGVAKKWIGVGLDDISAAVSNDEDAESPNTNSPGGTGSDASAISAQSIEALFQASIEKHMERLHAVDELKRAIEGLLEALHQKAKAALPMFVFVDELDRCRPDYAVRLLEGVKHLFDARGVCFVVSTNLAQLTESLKAVYGSGFDSYRYLKRLFAFEYSLPPPDLLAYSRDLVRESFLCGYQGIISGLVDWEKDNSAEIRLADPFAWVAEGFRLDLRTQQQVFRIAESACSGISPSGPLHALYLFSLAAVCHRKPEILDHANAGDPQAVAWWNEIDSLVDPRCKRSYVKPADRFAQTSSQNIDTRLLDLVKLYCQWATTDLKDLRDAQSRGANFEYPNSLGRRLAYEMPSQYYPNKAYASSISAYAKLVRYAGHRISESLS